MNKTIKTIKMTFKLIAIVVNASIAIYATEKNDSFDMEFFNSLSPINSLDMSDLSLFSSSDFAAAPFEHVSPQKHTAQEQKVDVELPVKKRKTSTSKGVPSKLNKEKKSFERAARLKNRNINKENILRENGCYADAPKEISPKPFVIVQPKMIERVLQPVNSNSTHFLDYLGEYQQDSYLSFMPFLNEPLNDLSPIKSQTSQSALHWDSDDLLSALDNWEA